MDDESRRVPRDKLEWDVEQMLWKAKKLLPYKVAGNFNPYRVPAGAVERVGSCSITSWHKQPLTLHGSPRRLAGGNEHESGARD